MMKREAAGNFDHLFTHLRPEFNQAMNQLSREVARFQASVKECSEAINEFKVNL